MHIFKTNVLVDNKHIVIVSKDYYGKTAEKRCRADAVKFTKHSGRTTHIYRIKNGTENNYLVCYYFVLPTPYFNHPGEFIEAIVPVEN